MKVLGIESSCDETAVAIVDEQKHLLANVVLSQIKQHLPYGGVVPEIAARNHLQAITTVLEQALQKSGLKLDDLDGVAATAGPGLMGGLLVGLLGAKTIAMTKNLPFIAVNHLEGHVLSVGLEHEIAFPYFCLLVSGGHCQMLLVKELGSYEILGQTLDDSVGETFDKVSRMLGLGYPGGVLVEQNALQGDPKRFLLPKPMQGFPGADFSFAGLKTAVLYRLRELKTITEQDKRDMCASFQQAVTGSLLARVQNALDAHHHRYPELKTFAVAGGVAANQYLRKRLETVCFANNLQLVAPAIKLCTDNGAMIAWTGLQRLAAGQRDPLLSSIQPRWPLTSLTPPTA